MSSEWFDDAVVALALMLAGAIVLTVAGAVGDWINKRRGL